MVVFSVTVPADSQAADWLSWPLSLRRNNAMCKNNQSTGCTEPCYGKRGKLQHIVAHVLVLFNLCSTDVTGGTYCTCMYFTHQTHCCTKIRKSTLFILVLESTCTAYIHPVVHVPALRCMHEANANCTPTHSHTDKSHANTRQVHTYHAPASQSAPWFPPDLGAKIRTSELKIHYGSMGGGSAERRAVGEEDKNESMLSRQGLRGKRGSWLKGEEREWGSEWERAGGKQKHWGVGLSAWWDM